MSTINTVLSWMLQYHANVLLVGFLALVTVAGLNETLNQLAFGSGNVNKKFAAIFAFCSTIIAIAVVCAYAKSGWLLFALSEVLGLFPVYLMQFWVAQRLLKKPISALIERFSSGWSKAEKKAKPKKVKVYQVGTDDAGNPIYSQDI